MLYRSNLSIKVYCFLLLFAWSLSIKADPTLINEAGCDILVYTNTTETPSRQRDDQDTCPDSNGSRAYVLTTPDNLGHGHLHHGSLESIPRPQLKEVAPYPNHHLKCLTNRTCYVIVRGFGVGYLDAMAILPEGESKCPPSTDRPSQSTPAAGVVIVQANHIASLASTRLPIPEASFTTFEIPDKITATNGKRYTLCYAPLLASETRVISELKTRDLHYVVGTLEISDELLKCDFEESLPPSHLGQGDLADTLLPCSFKNFRNRFEANLVWELRSGSTETLGTGPEGDSTPGLAGRGRYVYMDSPGYALGASATLVSTPIAYPKGAYCVQFSYNMYGEDVSTLRAYQHEVKLASLDDSAGVYHPHLSTDDVTVLGNWGQPRWVAVGNKGKAWHKGGFEFTATEMQTYQLTFEALAGKSEYGDIAIDDVSISPGHCPPEVRQHFPKTLGRPNERLVCGEVRLITGIHSTDKSWYVDGAVSCSGKGYSLDRMNQASWLPCCVPHFGTYKLVLEDQFGDGWSGSYLEFRFFDRLLTFGKDGFQQSGFDKTYSLVIGLLEIAEVQKTAGRHLAVNVRVARPNSFVWCGVVQAGRSGKVLRVDLSPDVLKQYGSRSSSPTKTENEIVHIEMKHPLKQNSKYDLYCHSEVVDENLEGERTSSLEQVKQQIAASRLRISSDDQAPILSDVTVVASTYDAVNVTIAVDESSASVWCVGIRMLNKEQSDGLFGPGGPPEGVTSLKDDQQRIARYFQESGDIGTNIRSSSDHNQLVEVKSLIPNSEYEIYCYAEDDAEPEANRMSIDAIKATKRRVRTLSKVPSVRIARRQTLHRGFELHVVVDTPGKAWCAAAPVDYGVPDVSEIVRVGAMAEINDPGKEVPLEIRGVEPNTPYVIYCVGGYSENRVSEDELEGRLPEYSEPEEMLSNSVSVVSYGRYCEEGAAVEIVQTVSEMTPFHPLTAGEEMRVRNYILGRPELGFEGLYRVNILPNKTEIKNFYSGLGPKPLRYARVRAGRCVNNVGIYEQLRVGPLDGTGPLSYERVCKPVETDCGGYNPQGVFGRRLSSDEVDWEDSLEKLSSWFKKSFGYEFGSATCVEETEELTSPKGSPLHPHNRKCLDFGPVMIEEVCDDNEPASACSSDQERRGRVWVGLKTPLGDQVPFYFIYHLPANHSVEQETAEDWVKRIIRDKELPDGFHEKWRFMEVWMDGKVFKSLESFLDSVSKGEAPKFDPEGRRRLQKDQMAEEMYSGDKKRRLQPQPYPGAAGTAGPTPSRRTRRGGLEYRAHPEHIESQGKRFQVEASADEEEFTITYAGWNMTVTNDRDTSLRIYHVSFLGQSVAFEMGLMEALAHYTVSERNWFFLDSWYGGLGAAARKVHKGIECPKTSVSLFWDGSLCVFEQDMARPTRVHWKGGDIQLGAPHTTLVLRQMLTVSNYDYVTDYRFHLTGIFEGSISFTGELYAGIEVPWYSARQAEYGVRVTGAMRFAAIHSHMAVWKVDLDVGPNDDWKENSVLITEVVSDPARPGANKMKRSFAETERDAIYFRNDTRAFVYEVVDEKVRIFGNTGGWRVVASPGINPLYHDFELYSGPAAWAKYRMFSTVHKYGEADSTLPRDNKYAKRPATAVDRYLMDNEPLRKKDIVTWIADGIFHIPVIEDMPFTVPIGNTLGWMIKPSNLFLEDPSMDLSNAMGGGVSDPGTCAVVRLGIGEVEPTLEGIWNRTGVISASRTQEL